VFRLPTRTSVQTAIAVQATHVFLSLAICTQFACSNAEQSTSTVQPPGILGHRLVGIWTGVLDADDVPPSENGWKELLSEREPAFSQASFLENRTMVICGMHRGNPVLEECAWEIVEEKDECVVLSLTRSHGVESLTCCFINDDLIYLLDPEDSTTRLYWHRDVALAPVPWLSKYSGRR
jgi:hypothetical protein